MDIGQNIEYLLTPVAQVALIIGLAELFKQIGLNKRWIPLVDLGLGLASGIFISIFESEVFGSPIQGVLCLNPLSIVSKSLNLRYSGSMFRVRHL